MPKIPIVTISIDEEHRLEIGISEEIGNMMNDDDTKGRKAAQKIYASEALALSLAVNARDLVELGVSKEEVIRRVLESLADNLGWALDVETATTRGPADENDNGSGNMLS